MPAKRLPPDPVPACGGPPTSRRLEGGRHGSAAGGAGMRPGQDGRTTGVSSSGDHVGGGRRRGASLQGGAASVPDKGCQPRERLRPVLWFLRCRRNACRGSDQERRCRRDACRGADRPAMPTKRLPRCGEGTGGRVADWPHGPPRKRGADGSGECPARCAGSLDDAAPAALTVAPSAPRDAERRTFPCRA
jgi:hypothetical protein